MIKLAIWAVLALALVATAEKSTYEKYRTEYTASEEYLHKQKLVFDVLYHFNQPQLNKELYEIGQNYDLEKNIDEYDDKVKSFLINGCVISPYMKFQNLCGSSIFIIKIHDRRF